MKRWAWLILIAFSTMLTHVPAVELPVQPEESSCCGCEGRCAMPDCAPTPANPAPVMERATTITRAALPSAKVRREQAFDFNGAAVFAPLAKGSTLFVAATPATAPRLFERYCSWLI